MTQIDVLGLGNAIMDVIAPVDDGFLDDHAITKGAMTLIDEARAVTLHKGFEKASKSVMEVAGGSGANTIVGIAKLGLNAAYVGKVGDDAVGTRFTKDMRDAGVIFNTKPLVNGPATARSLIAVTPDGERSMNTYLGASTAFAKRDVVKAQVETARVLYLEGYLFDESPAKAAYVKASEIAQAAGNIVALTLSDAFCVERHRESFRHLVEHHVDILFANEAEILSLYQVDRVDAALDHLAKIGKVACVTRSAKGSVIQDETRRYHVPAIWAETLVDTTGAGDQYAAGVLAGYIMGMGWADAGYLGSLCAGEVISHYGPRPEQSVHELALSGAMKSRA